MKPISTLTKKQIFDLQVKYSHIQPKYASGQSIQKWWESPLGWLNVCMNEKLSEEFVREFKDHIVWPTLLSYGAYHTPLSESFIQEMRDEGYIKV